jgi:hypothetical protein
VNPAEAMGMTYLRAIPVEADVPAGVVVVHNNVRPARRLGSRGFRAWLQPLTDERLEVCECRWAPEAGRHYRIPRRPAT